MIPVYQSRFPFEWSRPVLREGPPDSELEYSSRQHRQKESHAQHERLRSATRITEDVRTSLVLRGAVAISKCSGHV
jgi:hypothetical protein